MTAVPQVWTLENAAWTGSKPTLSVLIPVFRDDPCDLLRLLDREASALCGAVELVVLDDGSGDDALATRIAEVTQSLRLPARFIRLLANEGRSRGRNRLTANARAPYFLFLDADMLPDGPNFLRDWITMIEAQTPAVAFGGFTLEQTPLAPEHALHRALALRAECRAAAVRALEPEKSVCTSNLLVRRDVFEQERFDEAFKGWGWEDVEWAIRVSRRWPVRHVDNTASHLGLDTAPALASKYEQSPANFARVLAAHPEVAQAFPSYRVARLLGRAPLRALWRPLLKSLALSAGAPLSLRVAAMKLYRAALYAEVV